MFTGRKMFCAGLAVLSAVSSAQAVLIYNSGTPPTETRNVIASNSAAGTYTDGTTSAPIQDVVGQYDHFTGTAIGPHSFVFAKHTYSNTITTFTLGGVNYNITGVTADPSGSDLIVGTIAETFSNYAPLNTTSDESGESSVIFGRGRPAGNIVTSGSTVNGYDIAGAPAADGKLSFGQDTVDGATPSFLFWDFTPTNGSTTLTDADSGGALFVLNNGVWKLGGVNYGLSSPFSKSKTGSNPFDATIFEESGLFYNFGTLGWQAVSGPGASSATRISTQSVWLAQFVPEPGSLSILAVGGLLALRRRR